jgi:hypothetical protein
LHYSLVAHLPHFLLGTAAGVLYLSLREQGNLRNYSTFNSLRELKGFAWALALLPLLIDEAREPQRTEQRFVAGMLLGLCGVAAVIVWQRAVYAGLLDFAADYRVEGTFPELHTGGGNVHAYLVTAIPFVVAWMVLRPTAGRVALGAALFMLASYAIGVTFTRGAYVGYCGALVLMGIAMGCRGLRQPNWKLKRVAILAVLAAMGLAMMMPIVSGSFMEARLAGTQTQATTRMQRWTRTIDMMDKDLTTALFGMGLGRFPREFLYKYRDAASASSATSAKTATDSSAWARESRCISISGCLSWRTRATRFLSTCAARIRRRSSP